MPSVFKVRPSFPPLLGMALVFWAGSAIAWPLVGEFDYRFLCVFEGCVSIGSVILALLLARYRFRLPGPFLSVVVLMLVFVLACATAGGQTLLQSVQQQSVSGKSYDCSYRLLDDPRDVQGMQRVRAEITVPDLGPINCYLSGNDSFLLSYGASYEGLVLFQNSSDDNARYLHKIGAVAQAKLLDRPREVSGGIVFDVLSDFRQARINELTQADSSSTISFAFEERSFTQGSESEAQDASESYSSKSAERVRSADVLMVLALVLGERSNLYDSELYSQVKVLGIAHLVAVSGVHLSIVVALLSLLLKKIGVPFKWAIVFQLVFVVGYSLMVGLPVSCLRAAIMVIAASSALFFKRRGSALSSLGAAILVLVALDSSVAQSVSFCLSALSTLGIVLCMPFFAELIPFQSDESLLRRFLGGIYQAIALTISATFITLPVTVPLFNQLSLVAPLSNLFAAPFLTIICTLGLVWLAVAALFPGVSQLVLSVLLFFVDVLVRLINSVALLPHASIPLQVESGTAAAVCVLSLSVVWLAWTVLRQREMAARARSFAVAVVMVIVVALPLGYVVLPSSDVRLVMLMLVKVTPCSFQMGVPRFWLIRETIPRNCMRVSRVRVFVIWMGCSLRIPMTIIVLVCPT